MVSSNGIWGWDKNYPTFNCLVDKTMNMCESYLIKTYLIISRASSCRCIGIVGCLRYNRGSFTRFLGEYLGYLVKSGGKGALGVYQAACRRNLCNLQRDEPSVPAIPINECWVVFVPSPNAITTHLSYHRYLLMQLLVPS